MAPPSTRWPRRWNRAVALCAAAAAGAALTVAPARAEAGRQVAGADWQEAYIPVAGGTSLHADIFLPPSMPPGQRLPTIVEYSPSEGSYASLIWPDSNVANPAPGVAVGDPTDPRPIPDDDGLQRVGHIVDQHGYAFVIIDARGYGASGGCDDWFGPQDYADVVTSLDWLADRSWSNGHVGVYGGSFQGAFGLMALAAQKRHDLTKGVEVDAAQLSVALGDVYRWLYTNHNLFPYAMEAPAQYAGFAGAPPSPFASSSQLENRYPSSICPSASQGMLTAPNDPSDQYWQERNWIAADASVSTPVLIGEGFHDGNVRTNAWMDLWNDFVGPRYGWLGFYDHEPAQADDITDPRTTFPHIGYGGFLGEAIAFFDAYVKGLGPHASNLDGYPRVTVGEGHGTWRAERQWPIDQSTMTLDLAAGQTYTDVPGSFSETRGPVEQGAAVSVPQAMDGVGAWTETTPLNQDVHLTGDPKVDVTLGSGLSQPVTITAGLFQIDPDGRATVVSRTVYDTQTGQSSASFGLDPIDWEFPAGSRIGLLLAGSDLRWWYTPGHSGQTVTIAGGSLRLPLETCPAGALLVNGLSPSDAYKSLRPITPVLPPESIRVPSFEGQIGCGT